MNYGMHRLETEAEVCTAIARLEVIGCRVGVPTILRHGVLAQRTGFAAIVRRGQSFPTRHLATVTTPTIALIGDDDALPTGPLKWECAKMAGRWAAAVMVHGSGAEEAHYLAAIAAAEEVRRVLVVETSSAFVWRWVRFLAHPRTLVIAPPDGKPHPVASKETRH